MSDDARSCADEAAAAGQQVDLNLCVSMAPAAILQCLLVLRAC